MVRVGFSGILATLVDVFMLLVLVEIVMVPVAAGVFAASSLGAISSFVVNKFWAFRDRSPIHTVQIVGFAIVALGTAAGTAALVQMLHVGLGVPYLLAKAIGAAVLFLCWSYPAQSRLVFRTLAS